MCGIAGIVGVGAFDPVYRGVLGEMLDRLRHRGPDDAGEHVGPGVLLGHRRLSVIDLETGRQPISNENGSVWVVVNGELYDFLEIRERLIASGHVFRTTSDSECLVHLYEVYGERCVEHVSGMFAFAIWDANRRRLLLARDRLGVKPLYYAVAGGVLAFASELKSLLVLPGLSNEIDPRSLLDYLTFGFIPSPRTIFSRIRKLPPGCLLTCERGRVAVESYWDLHHRGHAEGGMDEASAEVWHALKRATRSRLVADVPVGALLSGGLDSGSVATAMARQSRRKIVTITCGFREQGFDERDAASRTALQLGSEHHVEVVDSDAAEIVDVLAWHFDEPFADDSAIPMYQLARAAHRHVTVALSGDGGDEVLAGYRRYRFDVYEEAVRRGLPRVIRRGLFGTLSDLCPRSAWLPRTLRAGATLRNLSVDGATGHALSIANLHPAEAIRLLDPDIAAEIGDYDPLDHVRRLYARCDAPDHLSKCQFVDIRFGLADGILTKVNRASMAHGLEVRSPMLDYRFVESAWRIAPRLRIRGRRGKAPLRHAMTRELGPEFARRPKAGFETPVDAWADGPLRARLCDGLLAAGAAVQRWVSPGAVGRAWTEHVSGRRRHGPLLWKLLMLDAWSRRHLASPTAPRELVSAS